MPVEIQEIVVDCAYCSKKTDKRAFYALTVKKIWLLIVLMRANYCGNCSFKLIY